MWDLGASYRVKMKGNANSNPVVHNYAVTATAEGGLTKMVEGQMELREVC